jgi:hypothetical protein
MKMLLSPLPFPASYARRDVACCNDSVDRERATVFVDNNASALSSPFGFVLERCPTLSYFLRVCVCTLFFFLYTLFKHSLLNLLFYSFCVCVCVLILPLFLHFLLRSLQYYYFFIISYFFFLLIVVVCFKQYLPAAHSSCPLVDKDWSFRPRCA